MYAFPAAICLLLLLSCVADIPVLSFFRLTDQVKLIRRDFDFIKLNGCNVSRSALHRPASVTELSNRNEPEAHMHEVSYSVGQVPK